MKYKIFKIVEKSKFVLDGYNFHEIKECKLETLDVYTEYDSFEDAEKDIYKQDVEDYSLLTILPVTRV